MINSKLKKSLYILGVFSFIFFGSIAFLQNSGNAVVESREKAAFFAILGQFISWSILIAPFFLPRFLPAVARFFEVFVVGKKTLFVFLATIAVLIEEGLAIIWNNIAVSAFSLWSIDNTLLTASSNYFDLITKHSVVVFLPMVVAWGFLLSRWRYNAGEAFLYLGMAGILAELLYAKNPIPLLWTGLWIFTYGFMVYTPALIVFGKEEKFSFSFRRAGFAILLSIFSAFPVAFFVLALTAKPA